MPVCGNWRARREASFGEAKHFGQHLDLKPGNALLAALEGAYGGGRHAGNDRQLRPREAEAFTVKSDGVGHASLLKTQKARHLSRGEGALRCDAALL
jgi:hypothetical protein